MAPKTLSGILLIGILLTGCAAGNRAVAPVPKHLTAGAKAMQRGSGWYRSGCFHRALDAFLAAHEFHVAADQQDGVAASLDSLGNVYRNLGDPHSAVRFHDEAVTIYQSLEDNAGRVQAMANKTAALIDADRLDDAARLLDDAEQLARDNKLALFLVLNNRGVLLTRKKDFSSAEASLMQALELANEKNPSEWGTVNFALGNLMKAAGRHDRALGYLAAALAADRAAGYHMGLAGDLAAMGEVYAAQRRDALAISHLKRSAQIYGLMGDRKKAEAILDRLGELSMQSPADLAVTRYFVERWLNGDMSESPCE